VLLLASVGFAVAADNDWMAPKDRLTLSGAQELAVFQSIRGHNVKKETALSGFKAEIGQPVPKAITLHKLPSDAASRVPTVKACDYAMLQNQLLIVNPHDRIAVDVIAARRRIARRCAIKRARLFK
jgi:hypothetical protein